MAEPAYRPDERPVEQPVGYPENQPLQAVPTERSLTEDPVHGRTEAMLPEEQRPLDNYDIRAWQGEWVFDESGEPVGKISDVLVDAQHRPEWLVVSFGALLREDRLVPVFDIRRYDHGYVVSYSKDMVREAPVVGILDLSDEDEQKLMSYWCTTRQAASPRVCTSMRT